MKKLTEKDNKLINNIIKNFNFEQAIEILKFVHDKYATTDDYDDENQPFVHRCYRVPTVQELVLEAKDMLEQVIKEDLQFQESGYLSVYRFKYTDKPGHYEVKLVLNVDNWEQDTDDLN